MFKIKLTLQHITIDINKETTKKVKIRILNAINMENLTYISILLSLLSCYIALINGWILAYGDAESHLNIAKRVINGLTPGFAQLGGIWPPIPHILLMPFVLFDPFWRSGLAGSLVSGICFIISSLTIYKLVYLITKNKISSLIAYLVFALNPNILYMQATPMTELVLIAFFLLSTYFFAKFLLAKDHVIARPRSESEVVAAISSRTNDTEIISLVISAFFTFCATLTRYDGWFLVIFQILSLLILYLYKKETWKKTEGKLIVFMQLGLLGIFLWLGWDGLILGDPFYFNHSEYSAKAQQLTWYTKGQLPAYKNLFLSLQYYTMTSLANAGTIIFLLAIVGLVIYIFTKPKAVNKQLIALILLVPFIFYVVSLFLGEAVIFIPSVTPQNFAWKLFNVRYGLMIIPACAFFVGYLFYRASKSQKLLILALLLLQILWYPFHIDQIITLQDGRSGLSQAKQPDAEKWLIQNYDYGLVLEDDYNRSVSIIKSGIPMQNIIYVGTKPYWEQSLQEPEKYARWIIIQKNDQVWKNLYEDPTGNARLYKYFQKTYTSKDTLIFKRQTVLPPRGES